MAKRVASIVLVAGLLVGGACTDDGSRAATPATSPGGPPAEVPALDDAGLKPQLIGLLDRKGMPRPKFQEQLDGFVVSVDWSDLQPEPFGPLAADNAIDRAIEAIRRGPRHLRLKLRVLAGVHAPEWLHELTGGAVAVSYEGYDSLTGSLPRFWTTQHAEAYADLQRRLAASYDDTPEIQQVVITQCMTFYAEPLLRQAGTPATPQALLDAGYSVEADQRCQHSALEAHQVWEHTRSSMAFNPYQVLNSDGSTSSDPDISIELMERCRAVLGPRCVLENYSLSWPLRTGELNNYAAIYSALERLGPPLSFQTAAASRIGDWQRAIGWATDLGAGSVELNRSYPRYPEDRLARVREDLLDAAR